MKRNDGGLGLYYRGWEIHVVEREGSAGLLCYGPSSRELPGAVADLVRQFASICTNSHITRNDYAR